jgi:hypothetical protein
MFNLACSLYNPLPTLSSTHSNSLKENNVIKLSIAEIEYLLILSALDKQTNHKPSSNILTLSAAVNDFTRAQNVNSCSVRFLPPTAVSSLRSGNATIEKSQKQHPHICSFTHDRTGRQTKLEPAVSLSSINDQPVAQGIRGVAIETASSSSPCRKFDGRTQTSFFDFNKLPVRNS